MKHFNFVSLIVALSVVGMCVSIVNDSFVAVANCSPETVSVLTYFLIVLAIVSEVIWVPMVIVDVVRRKRARFC